MYNGLSEGSYSKAIYEMLNAITNRCNYLYTVKRVLFAGVNVRDIEITANSRFLIFAVDRIIKK